MSTPVSLRLRAVVLATLLGSGIGFVGMSPAVAGRGQVTEPALPYAATIDPTVAAMGRTLFTLLNRDRIALGRRPLIADSRLGSLARDRAHWMAAHNVLSHTSAGGTPGHALATRRITVSLAGECIGWTNATWGSQSARWLYNAWKDSPEHWTLMVSPRFTRIGIGFAYRSAGELTYGSLVLARI